MWLSHHPCIVVDLRINHARCVKPQLISMPQSPSAQHTATRSMSTPLRANHYDDGTDRDPRPAPSMRSGSCRLPSSPACTCDATHSTQSHSTASRDICHTTRSHQRAQSRCTHSVRHWQLPCCPATTTASTPTTTSKRRHSTMTRDVNSSRSTTTQRSAHRAGVEDEAAI